MRPLLKGLHCKNNYVRVKNVFSGNVNAKFRDKKCYSGFSDLNFPFF